MATNAEKAVIEIAAKMARSHTNYGMHSLDMQEYMQILKAKLEELRREEEDLYGD